MCTIFDYHEVLFLCDFAYLVHFLWIAELMKNNHSPCLVTQIVGWFTDFFDSVNDAGAYVLRDKDLIGRGKVASL